MICGDDVNVDVGEDVDVDASSSSSPLYRLKKFFKDTIPEDFEHTGHQKFDLIKRDNKSRFMLSFGKCLLRYFDIVINENADNKEHGDEDCVFLSYCYPSFEALPTETVKFHKSDKRLDTLAELLRDYKSLRRLSFSSKASHLVHELPGLIYALEECHIEQMVINIDEVTGYFIEKNPLQDMLLLLNPEIDMITLNGAPGLTITERYRDYIYACIRDKIMKSKVKCFTHNDTMYSLYNKEEGLHFNRLCDLPIDEKEVGITSSVKSAAKSDNHKSFAKASSF